MEVRLGRNGGLQLVQKIVEPKQALLPILANVLLETESLCIIATDLEITARVRIPVQVVKPGAIMRSARKLLEIVKELPPSPIALAVQESAWVALRCAEVGLGLPPQDFPTVQEVDSNEWVGLGGKMLKKMLAETSFALSHDESRCALNGVLFSIRPKEVRLVATDGHRLAFARRGLDYGGQGATGIIPRKTVHEVTRVLEVGESVHVALSGMPNFFLLTARLIKGQPPNYEQMLPKGQAETLALINNLTPAND